jgi:hypothetical protein
VNLTSVSVLVDVNYATGIRLDALAAYLAFVTLAPTKLPPRAVPVRSISNLFARPEDADTDLTDWDRAYLKALYRIVPNQSGFAQRAAMVGAMADAIAAR